MSLIRQQRHPNQITEPWDDSHGAKEVGVSLG